MKLAIVGGRDFDNYALLSTIVDELRTRFTITEIVSGGAAGTDSLGKRYAQDHTLPLMVFEPNWKKYGKAAGVIRNTDIIVNADIVLAIWDGASKGTNDSIRKAKKYNKRLFVHDYKGQQSRTFMRRSPWIIS
jgi:hypothetical protein